MADWPITPRVIINGIEAAARRTALHAGEPTILDGLSFNWGRGTIVDQADSSVASFTIRQRITGDPGQEFLFSSLHAGQTVQIRAVDESGDDRLIWAGEIAKATVQPVSGDRIDAAVTCVDGSSLLSNDTVGDEPWPQEAAGSRLARILTATTGYVRDVGYQPDPPFEWQISSEIDSSIASIPVARRDVDAQEPLGLIQDLARSIGGVAWITADESGPYIWLEDPSRRPGLRQFMVDPVTNAVTIDDVGALARYGVNLWPAKNVAQAPLTWTQDPAQVVTAVQLTWKQPGADEAGEPTLTERTVRLTDSVAVRTYGIRRMTVATDLVGLADANRLAARWLGQIQSAVWIVSGLSIDTSALRQTVEGFADEDRLAEVMTLLDIRQRIGHRLTVTGLPSWSPFGEVQSLYVEGGTYTWGSGRWRLDLTASANAIGGGALAGDFPAGTVAADFGDLRGRDIWGVGGPNFGPLIVPFVTPGYVESEVVTA